MDYFSVAINQYKKRLDDIKKHIRFISLQKELFNQIKTIVEWSCMLML